MKAKTSSFLEKFSDRVRNLTLSNYITSFIFSVITIITFLLSFYVFSLLKENKYKDITAIMFLELEKYSDVIKDKFDIYENKLIESTSKFQNIGSADSILSYEGGKKFKVSKGGLRNEIAFSELGLDNINDIKKFFILQISGVNYFAKKILDESNPEKIWVYLWNFDVVKTLGFIDVIDKDNIVYILSHEFRVIFTNAPEVVGENLLGRELVQNFIKSPIKKGQVKVKNKDSSVNYGFYSEISDSNIVIFSEISENVVTSIIFGILKSFMIGVSIILLIALVIVQIVIPSITGPLKELVELTKKISSGQFDVETKSKGFGEISLLLKLFSEMAKRLQSRDTKIVELMEDKRERDRLDRELLIAQKIQENFLPSIDDVVKSGLSVVSYYKPAEEVAGDWYQQYYDEKTDEFIVIVADVSGHGSGSSMFTAVIAAHFEHYKIRRGPNFTISDFIIDLNKIIIKLGKREWHATMIIAIISSDKKSIELINCGHPFPLMIVKKDRKNVVKGISMPSSPVGLVEELSIYKKTLPLTETTSFLFFTDGIIEAANAEKKQYGRKNLIKQCENLGSIRPSLLLEDVKSKLYAFLDKEKPNDDICLFVLNIS